MLLSKDYDALWNLLKDTNSAPVYMEKMDEEESKIPPKFVIFQRSTNDNGSESGDGVEILRDKYFTISIYAKKINDAVTIMDAYRNKLIQNGIRFTQQGPLYDTTSQRYTIDLDGRYSYGV